MHTLYICDHQFSVPSLASLWREKGLTLRFADGIAVLAEHEEHLIVLLEEEIETTSVQHEKKNKEQEFCGKR